MSAPLPRPPLWLVATAFVGGVALLFLAAAVQGPTLIAGVLTQLLEATATVVLAVAFGAGFLGAWQRREWQRRTERVAFDSIEQARRHLAQIVQICVKLVGVPAAATSAATAVRIPWSETCAKVLTRVGRDVMANADELFGPRTPESLSATGSAYQESVALRLQAVRVELESRADRLTELAAYIASFTDDRAGPRLQVAASEVRRKTQDVIDPVTGIRLGPVLSSMFLAPGIPALLDAVCSATEQLSSIFLALERGVSSEKLKAELRAQMKVSAERDEMDAERLAFEDEQRKSVEAMAASKVEGERQSAQLDAYLSEFLKEATGVPTPQEAERDAEGTQ